MAFIVLKNVRKIYGDLEAVKGVNLEVEQGEFCCLLGPSGCGKTSTLRMVAGLEKIDGGEIWIDDRMVNDLRPRNRDIAMAFEKYALYPHLTVYENIAFPLRVRKLSNKEIDKRVREMAEILYLQDILQRYPKSLSDGQKQRVSIGRALVREPKVFLLDEPLSHVDVQLRVHMRKEIKRIISEMNVTALYVTHDQEEALSIADKVVVMNNGRIQQVGSPQQLLDEPRNLFTADFVGEPAMNFLPVTIIREKGVVYLQGEGFRLRINKGHGPKLLERVGMERVIFAIRPAYITVSECPLENSIPANVYVTEPLGDFNIVTVTIDKHFLRAEVDPAVMPPLKSDVWLSFPPDRILLFDPDTGLNLAH